VEAAPVDRRPGRVEPRDRAQDRAALGPLPGQRREGDDLAAGGLGRLEDRPGEHGVGSGKRERMDGALMKVVFAERISRVDALRLLCKVVAFVEGCDDDVCDALDAHRPAWTVCGVEARPVGAVNHAGDIPF
jgi:hypothetical protein